MKVLRNGKAIELPDDSEKASRMLMEAADFFAATLAKADPRAWEALLTYRPISESRPTKAAEAMREAAALAVKSSILKFRATASRGYWPGYHEDMIKAVQTYIRALPLPEPPPDSRDATIGTDVSDAAIADATIARLSAELEAAREALDPFAAYAEWLSHLSDESNVLSFHRGRLDWLHLIAGDFRRARAVRAKLAKGE